LEVIMKNFLSKAASLALLAALLCGAASLSSCDSILFTGYRGEKGDKGDTGDQGPPGDGSGSGGPPPSGKPAGSAISPAWAVALISRDKHEFTIEDNAAPAYDTGQGVEYSATLSGSRAAAGQAWIEGSRGEVTFVGLTPDTDYYVWARSKENAAYGAGPARADVGGMVTTRPLNEDPFAFASLAGERNAMYYLVPDPADPDKKLDLSSPEEPLSWTIPASKYYYFAPGDTANSPSGYSFSSLSTYASKTNRITLHGIPLRSLIDSVPTETTPSGYCYMVYRIIDDLGRMSTNAANLPLNGTAITVSSLPPGDYAAYPAPEPFSGYNGNTELPKTRDYSSALRVYRDMTFYAPVSKAVLESLCVHNVAAYHYDTTFHDLSGLNPSYADVLVKTDGHIYNDSYNNQMTKLWLKRSTPNDNGHATSLYFPQPMGADLLPTVTTSERHKLSSAGYYQYLTLAVEYPPDISVFNVAASPIVESFSFDADANTISVVFKDYDSPYAGPVLTYTLVSADGKQQQKTVEIK
jgi:hypothetical protein